MCTVANKENCIRLPINRVNCACQIENLSESLSVNNEKIDTSLTGEQLFSTKISDHSVERSFEDLRR